MNLAYSFVTPDLDKKGPEILEFIDPSLEFVRFLGPSDIVTGTCQARLDGRDVVVKYVSQGLSLNSEIQNELNVLRRLERVRRVPNVRGVYETFDYRAICKDYIEGISLLEYAPSRAGLGQSALSLVEEIHREGVGRLDLRSDSNYLVRNGEIWLFDFGTAVFRNETEQFEVFAKEDLEDVRGKFR